MSAEDARQAIPLAIRHAAQARRLAPGEVLARQGDAPRWMYFVVEGEIRLSRSSLSGAPVILQRVRRGWVAEASLFARRYHCELVAGPPTVCLRVPARRIHDAFRASTDFCLEWIASLSQELRRTRGACERLGMRSAEQRVLHAIESDGDGGVLPLAGSLKDWAAELGITHEALYRTLAKMEAAGVVRKGPGEIAIARRNPRGGP